MVALNRMLRLNASPDSELRNFFTDPEVLEMVLDGFCQWGKEKFDAIRLLIKHIGPPCVEPLMERLAAEQAITLRRAYLNALLDLGEIAREAAIARLADGRWYVVRNIIVILRKLNDRNLMIHFRRLRNHPHPRVRFEIMKTLQYYRDPEADRLLVQYMDGTERDLRLHAIMAAECSRSPAVFQKLVELMGKGGVAGHDYEIRVAALRTLAHMANCAAIPEIAKLLESKSRLRPALLNQLKAEALRSLTQYPMEAVLPVLARAIDSGQPELANIARELVQNLRGQK
jgi:HEAT repeat protein